MPASSLFADMERPAPATSGGMDDTRALQLALELLGLNDSSTVPSTDPDHFVVPGLEDRSKRSQNMTECVAVPSSEHVAEIVGRQGCKIKALRAKTNTYIKTPVRGEDPVFVVTGRKEDVGMAKREILSAAEHFSQIRACRKNNLNGSMVPGPPAIPGQVTIQVRVPYRVVGLVVGPKGATIKRIQQQTHTYIVTPSRDKEPVFEVTGMPESVEQAKKEIEAHIAMRTGGLLEPDEASMVAALARQQELTGGIESLFSSSSDVMSSLYKLNNPSSNLSNGFSGIGGLHDLQFSLLSETLGNKSSLDSPLFSSLNSNKLNDGTSALGSFYSADEGLGSLGSSIGSSPSFEPSSIWGDVKSAFGSTINSTSSLSSTLSSLTRRSSSVSGASPPSSRLSPTLESHRMTSEQPPIGTSLMPSTNSSSASSSPDLNQGMASLLASTDLTKSEKRCITCFDASVDAALVPCGHNLFCLECAKKLTGEGAECPICHRKISQAIRIFS